MGRGGPTRTNEQRFWSFIEKTETCWLWRGALQRGGYGLFNIQLGTNSRLSVKAHRYSWQLSYGPIPPGEGHHGTCVLHTCDTPACVRPEHLFLGTPADNMLDKVSKGRQSRMPGEDHPMCKLSQQQVTEIREIGRLPKGSRPAHTEIARMFGVSRSLVGLILNNQRWPQVIGAHSV